MEFESPHFRYLSRAFLVEECEIESNQVVKYITLLFVSISSVTKEK